MPSKKPSPLEHPPSASSSEASSSDDGEQEVETTPQKPQETTIVSSKKPTTTTTQSSSSEEEGSENESGDDDDAESDDDDDDSDGEDETEKNNNTPLPLEVKPISSKPMNIDPKPKNETIKRRLEEEIDEKDLRKDIKKKKVSDLVEGGGEDVGVGGAESEKKKESGGGSGSGGTDDGKKLFQRVWSDEDEYVILKGMISLKKKGMDPSAPSHSTALFDYIKDSLSIVDVHKSQLSSKIRTLKRKFLNTAKRSKNGEDPEISKPHDLKVYQYAKKVWGDEVEGKSVLTDVGKKSKNTKIVNNGVELTPRPKVLTLPSSSPVVVAQNVEGNGNAEYPYLNESVQSRSYSIVPMQGLGEVFAKRGWDAIGSSNAKDLNKRWKGLLAAEAKLYLDRVDLVRDQTKMMLDALDSSAP